jgi:hypothetical protein
MRRSTDTVAPRIVRLIWLAGLLLWRGPACLAEYRDRFGISVYACRRDLKTVREFGQYLELQLYVQCACLIYLRIMGLPIP